MLLLPTNLLKLKQSSCDIAILHNDTSMPKVDSLNIAASRNLKLYFELKVLIRKEHYLGTLRISHPQLY